MSFIYFTRKAEIPDFQPAEQASSEEASEQASDLFTNAGSVALPGVPGDEPYLIGMENNGVQGIGANHPAFSDDSGMPGVEADDFGMESAGIGLNPGNASDGLTSDGRAFFNDGVHPDDTGGVDAMRGLAPIPSLNPLPDIAGNGQAQASDAGYAHELFDNASYGPYDLTDE